MFCFFLIGYTFIYTVSYLLSITTKLQFDSRHPTFRFLNIHITGASAESRLVCIQTSFDCLCTADTPPAASYFPPKHPCHRFLTPPPTPPPPSAQLLCLHPYSLLFGGTYVSWMCMEGSKQSSDLKLFLCPNRSSLPLGVACALQSPHSLVTAYGTTYSQTCTWKIRLDRYLSLSE